MTQPPLEEQFSAVHRVVDEHGRAVDERIRRVEEEVTMRFQAIERQMSPGEHNEPAVASAGTEPSPPIGSTAGRPLRGVVDDVARVARDRGKRPGATRPTTLEWIPRIGRGGQNANWLGANWVARAQRGGGEEGGKASVN